MNRAIAILLVLASGTAIAAPPPPEWERVLADAKGIWSRHRAEQSVLQKMVRAGDPRTSARRTPVELVPEAFQDVECVFQGKRFGELARQTMTLHYEHGLGGWTMVGYSWGDKETVRAGAMPEPPPPPSQQEIFDAVRAGLREWRVRQDDVEKVSPTGKSSFAWLDEVPTPGYTVPVRVSVRDVVDKSATYGARYKTRFVCDLKVQLALEDQVTWTMQGTVPDCASAGCSLARLCKDTWGPGAPPVGKSDERPPREEARRAPAAPPPTEKPAKAPPPTAKAGPVVVKSGQLESAGRCPAGQFATPATSGHCCWSQQVYSTSSKSCVGVPRCPTGYVAQGTDCAKK